MKIIRHKNLLLLGCICLGLLALFSGCANAEVVGECLQGKTYGFWHGLWHGLIAPVHFVLSLFNQDYTLYAQNNNGAWYAFGFLIGSGGWGFLGGRGAKRKKKTPKNAPEEAAVG